MKEKFINKCKDADLIQMNGIILQYLPSSNELCYRVLGEFNYLALNDLEDGDFGYDGEWYTIKRGNALFKFKFYTEIKDNHGN